jgi:Concanavalin A-like lectin/glucanases superfamily
LKNKFSSFLCVSALALYASSGALAAVTTIASYKLGEDDPGAVAGALAADPTLPSAGALNLPRIGTPSYSSIPGVGAPRPSALSVGFNGVSDGFRANALITNATDNFGIELWARPTSAVGNSVLAYNGNTSTSGAGLFRFGSDYAVLYGGNALMNAPNSVDLNQWTHLALVRASGTTTLYKNGVAIATTPIGPNPPAGGFSIGINPLVDGEFFSGNIDEVRVFTFAAGQFALSDLSFRASFSDPIPPVPVNAWQSLLLALLATAALGAFAARAKSKR